MSVTEVYTEYFRRPVERGLELLEELKQPSVECCELYYEYKYTTFRRAVQDTLEVLEQLHALIEKWDGIYYNKRFESTIPVLKAKLESIRQSTSVDDEQARKSYFLMLARHKPIPGDEHLRLAYSPLDESLTPVIRTRGNNFIHYSEYVDRLWDTEYYIDELQKNVERVFHKESKHAIYENIGENKLKALSVIRHLMIKKLRIMVVFGTGRSPRNMLLYARSLPLLAPEEVPRLQELNAETYMRVIIRCVDHIEALWSYPRKVIGDRDEFIQRAVAHAGRTLHWVSGR